MSDREFAAFIDQMHNELNTISLPPQAQYWTPEMLIEMLIASTIDLDWPVGAPNDQYLADVCGEEMLVLEYRDGNAPPPLSPEQQARLDEAIADAKASYWRGKEEDRLS